MPQLTAAGTFAVAQATELAVLVDLEARWENMRKLPLRESEAKVATQELQAKQKAYEAFHGKLVAYNKRFAPPHVPELLLNNPARLGVWCRKMRDLYRQVEQDPQSRCPTHVLEKAQRWADQICARTNEERVNRAVPPDTIRAAIQELDTLSLWCDTRVSEAGHESGCG